VSVGGSSTWDEEDRNFGEQWQGRSESEISGHVRKMEKGDIIALSAESLSFALTPSADVCLLILPSSCVITATNESTSALLA
jgi:hypothetical protein